MKKWLWILITTLAYISTQANGKVDQEIRYICKGANEVYLVWGVNNWQVLNSELPKGSFIKEKLIYTPMTAVSDNAFSVHLKVSGGDLIDYVFWITKGPLQKTTNLWDTNEAGQKDYHTLAVPNTITLINSKVNVKPVTSVSVLDFSYLLLIVSIAVFSLLYLIRRKKMSLAWHPVLIIVCTALSLLILLLLIRPSVLGISWEVLAAPLQFMPQVAWAGFYDTVYVLVLTLIFLSLTLLLKKYPLMQTILCSLFVVVCCFSLVVSILNIRIVENLGKPFNYQWLYYSGFLKSTDAKAALSANLSSAEISRILSVCCVAFFGALTLFIIISSFPKNKIRYKIVIPFITVLIITYGLVSTKQLDAQPWSYDRLANPVTAFLESVNPYASNPALFTMEVADSLKYKAKAHSNTVISGSGKIKNVIIYVLESTPAEYIETYGGKYPVTPQIKKYSNQSITFENIYAHAPSTNMSMLSMLGSIYPWLSYQSITEEHPGLKISTISQELKNRGYRTAFFNSADNRYQKAGEFLSHRKFDLIKDCRDNECGQGQFKLNIEKWDYMDGKDDNCSGKELSEWIKEDNKPFFCMMWTYQTHYPYFFTGNKINYNSGDTVFNRYLNALQYDDNVLGNIIEQLKQNELFESTLLVVIGDHGEAFGRHDQTTHARKIYEENLHVPCILINPSFKAERRTEIGGMIDLAPTIMNILGYNIPVQWQGESLFEKDKMSRAFFFAPWSDYLFGYREGDYKYIYNATKNETEVYNLKTDPFESRNLAIEKKEAISIYHQRIAGWAQYVNDATGKLLKQ